MLFKLLLLVESIFFVEVNDWYILLHIDSLPLQQIVMVYKLRRYWKPVISTSLHPQSACLIMSQQDSMDTQNILKPYEQNVYFPLVSKSQS